MGIVDRLAILVLLAFASVAGAANAPPGGPPTREGLIAAWEARMSAEGTLEKQGDGSYRLDAPAIGYAGRLVLDGALVREQPYAAQTGIGHIGVVDFSLPDLPPARAGAQGVLMWRAGLQQFVHRADRGWVHGEDAYDPEAMADFGAAGWWNLLLGWGGWLFILLVLAAIGLLGARQARRARAIMDESDALHAKARDNLDRARALHEEQAELARRSIAVTEEGNRLLAAILDELRRGR
jgi:hypothetical protein